MTRIKINLNIRITVICPLAQYKSTMTKVCSSCGNRNYILVVNKKIKLRYVTYESKLHISM